VDESLSRSANLRLRSRLGDVWWSVKRRLRRQRGPEATFGDSTFEAQVVAAQVEAADPYLIFHANVRDFSPSFLSRLKRPTRRLIGECGYAIPVGTDLSRYDLLVSCNPGFVERFRRAGARAALLRHAFDPEILDRLGPTEKSEDVVFIGSLTRAHRERMELLEAIIRRLPLRCWGTGGEDLPPESPLRGAVARPLWGYDMYRQLQRAKLTVNIHVDASGDFAANQRLFEATGVGTLLITDRKSNLRDMFEPGREVVVYRTIEECIELIQHYLEHAEEREAIAAAGQRRTLRDHTSGQRMRELDEILRRNLP
jgi:hypothetical protein